MYEINKDMKSSFRNMLNTVLEKLDSPDKKNNKEALEYARANVGKIESKHDNKLYFFKYLNPTKNEVEESTSLPLAELKDLRSQVLISLAMHYLGEENHMVYEGGYWTQYIIHRDEFNKPR
jgi:hypothetical protein